jgi:hypothetical protein
MSALADRLAAELAAARDNIRALEDCAARIDELLGQYHQAVVAAEAAGDAYTLATLNARCRLGADWAEGRAEAVL